MEVINNKLHLSDDDYADLALRIETEAENRIIRTLSDTKPRGAKLSCSIEDDSGLLEVSAQATVFFDRYWPGNYDCPESGGDINEISINWLHIAGWVEEGAIEVEFDPEKLKGELVRVSNKAVA